MPKQSFNYTQPQNNAYYNSQNWSAKYFALFIGRVNRVHSGHWEYESQIWDEKVNKTRPFGKVKKYENSGK